MQNHTSSIAAKDLPWSEYADECWGSGKDGLIHEPGGHYTQRRVLHLMNQLGIDVRATPASNLIFQRTSTESNIKGKSELIRLCWPFHEATIEKLGIKMVICFGQTVGHAVRQNLGASRKLDEFQERNKRRWRSSVYEVDSGRLVAVLTHPARADWTKQASDPSPMLRRVLGT